MKIYLVRHAQKEEEGENPNLTKRGLKQAEYLARRLKKMKFDGFYCSDLSRAKQTSAVVSKAIRMKPKVVPSLNEYEAADIKKDDKKWPKDELSRRKKLHEFLDKVIKHRKKETNILVIAHGITNRIIMSYLLEMPLKRMIILRQEETCINLLSWNEKFGNWNLKKMNDSNHLPERLRGYDKRG